jgi:hypothetical protein
VLPSSRKHRVQAPRVDTFISAIVLEPEPCLAIVNCPRLDSRQVTGKWRIVFKGHRLVRTLPRRRRRMIKFINLYVLPVLLPVVSAVAAAFAGASTGTPRGVWIILGIVAVAGTAILSVVKARQAERAKEHQLKLTEVAVEAKAKLATALSAAGNPLISELAELSTLRGDACHAKFAALVANATAVAASQCSRNASNRTRVRAAFYQFRVNGLNRLDLVKAQGRDGDPPAQFFDRRRTTTAQA